MGAGNDNSEIAKLQNRFFTFPMGISFCRLSISAAISLIRSKRSISNTSFEYVTPVWAMNCNSFAHSSHWGCIILFNMMIVSIGYLICKGMENEILHFCPMLKNHRLDLILLKEDCVIPKKEAICPKFARWKMLGYSFISFS